MHRYVFFFLRIRRPPRSTLFPHTTLSGSARPPNLMEEAELERLRKHRDPASFNAWKTRVLTHIRRTHGDLPWSRDRSEEHTSELQSRQYLVCRLLLEKKKITKYLPITSIF